MLHIDPSGRVWVAVIVGDERWRPLDWESRTPVMSELYDARIEVVEPDAGVVVASFRYDGIVDQLPPFTRFFPGTARAYRVTEDSLGLAAVRIFDIHVVARKGR